MLFWTIIKVSLKSLLAHKLRSFLAMLGIIIGVAAVISMLALGAGAQKRVMDRISAMGTNLLVIRPGQRGSRGVMSGTQQNLTIQDAESILKKVPGIHQITPVVRGNAQLKYLNKNSRTSVIGTAVTYFLIQNFEVENGRTFSENEVERRMRVAVLGSVTAQDLFGSNDPVGETVKIKGINFKVVGVLKSKGDQGWANPDDQAVIPFTTAMKQVFGMDYLSEIDIQANTNDELNDVQEKATAVLRSSHRLQPDTDDDFNIHNQAQMLETASSITQTFTILLGGIASISLLVGGIGIMNIMLVTVTERTKEIGIRKAIGAKEKDILRQFLLEALIMSGLGGLFGVAFGAGGGILISNAMSFPSVIEIRSILLALSFSGAVGVFFGYYPARRAAVMDPIEALRYE